MQTKKEDWEDVSDTNGVVKYQLKLEKSLRVHGMRGGYFIFYNNMLVSEGKKVANLFWYLYGLFNPKGLKEWQSAVTEFHKKYVLTD